MEPAAEVETSWIETALLPSVIPPQFQEAIMNSLKDNKISCTLIEVDEKHGMPPASVFVTGLDFVVLGNSIQ